MRKRLAEKFAGMLKRISLRDIVPSPITTPGSFSPRNPGTSSTSSPGRACTVSVFDVVPTVVDASSLHAAKLAAQNAIKIQFGDFADGRLCIKSSVFLRRSALSEVI